MQLFLIVYRVPANTLNGSFINTENTVYTYKAPAGDNSLLCVKGVNNKYRAGVRGQVVWCAYFSVVSGVDTEGPGSLQAFDSHR